jgi:hypothetical protein
MSASMQLALAAALLNSQLAHEPAPNVQLASPLPAAAPLLGPVVEGPVLGASATLSQPGDAQAVAPAIALEPAPSGRSAANNPMQDEMTQQLDASVSKGLATLARMQNADGSWSDTAFGRSVAVTALACIALMADGNVPGRGAYGDNVERGLEYILRNCGESGLIATDSASSPMYGHGFAALFLGEIYGMTAGGGDTDLANRTYAALSRATRLIETTQNEEGGWRYNPVPFDADTSVTICQIMALRSARNAGLEVSKAVIDRAVEYVRACQNPDGGFRYQGVPGGSAWPRSAAGVASLQYAGIYEDRAIETGMGYLFRVAMPGRGNVDQMHYFYGQYYAVQAAFLKGGETWERWWPAAREELLGSQTPSGLWRDPTVGDEYGTAMALIVLQMPKRYLPIFQK